jgi:hypothetical protein
MQSRFALLPAAAGVFATGAGIAQTFALPPRSERPVPETADHSLGMAVLAGGVANNGALVSGSGAVSAT